MDHLRAVMRQFARLVVTEGGERHGLRDDARIGRHDAVHVRPDPDLGGDERRADHRRAVVRAAAPAERHRLPVRAAPDEAGDDGHRPRRDQRREDVLAGDPRRLDEWVRVAEDAVRDDALLRRDGDGGNAHTAQRRGDDRRGALLAARRDAVDERGHRLAHRADRDVEAAERFEYAVSPPRARRRGRPGRRCRSRPVRGWRAVWRGCPAHRGRARPPRARRPRAACS